MELRVRRLPSEYQEVEYLESNGKQRIETSFSNNFCIEGKAKFITSRAGGQVDILFGCSSGARRWLGVQNSAFSGTSHKFTSNPFEDFTFSKTYSFNDKVITTTVNINNETSGEETGTSAYPVAPLSFFDGYYSTGTNPHWGDYCCNARLYFAKIYNLNKTHLLADFVPCKKSNNEYGLYDLVSKTFFGNQGSGSFTGGAVIHTTDKITIPQGEVAVIRQNNQKIWQRVPWEYEEVEYILPTERGAWIDTNFYPTDKCKVEIAYIPSSTTTVFETVIGCQTSGTAGDNRFYILLSATHYYLQLNHNSSDGHFTGLNANGTSLDNSNGNISQYQELTKVVLDSKNQTWLVKSDHYNTHGVLLGTHKSITNTAQTMSLFGRKTAGAVPVTNAFTGKMYYCKIWDDDILIRYFVPCKKGNVYGMYDLVSGTFFGNQGTGDFTGGNIK